MDKGKKRLVKKLMIQSGIDDAGHMILKHTDFRTESLDEMEPQEANLMIVELQGLVSEVKSRIIKKIIHMCCLCGMTTQRGYPDYTRINTFIENIGSRNPKRRKNVNYLTHSEALAVLNQVSMMARKSLAKA